MNDRQIALWRASLKAAERGDLIMALVLFQAGKDAGSGEATR